MESVEQQETEENTFETREEEDLNENVSQSREGQELEENTSQLREECFGDGRSSECDFTRISELLLPTTEEPVRLALLPPDHPLLQRFQAMLKDYLLRTKISLSNEIAEIKYQLKLKEAAREEEGAKLYDLQQGINRQNEQLEEYTQEMEANIQKRLEMEAKVTQLKDEYEKQLANKKEQKQKYNKRMVELENLNTLEGNIRNWADEVEDEVKNAKRIVNRDTQLQKQLSEEKKKSDMLFLHLDTEVKKKEKEAEIMRSEVQDMRDITNMLKGNINDANTDLQVLENEHKRLTQAWGEVIVAIAHRDKIFHQVTEAMEKEQETIKLNAKSIEAIKKQITKEIKLNEKLESFKQRLVFDCGNLKRECQKQSETLQALQNKLEELPLWLEQNEKDLSEATREGSNLGIEIHRLQWKADKQYSKKFHLEENILKTAQEQLITDKASQYRLKLLHQAQNQRRKMELSLAQTNNTLADALLDVERNKSQIFRLKRENDVLHTKLTDAEKGFDAINIEIAALDTQVDLKLKKINRLSIRIDELNRKGAEVGLDSTTKKIKLVEKALHVAEQQIREHQQFWLMLQNHYVNLSEKRNQQRNEILITQKQLSIIKQKSLKIDIDLEAQEIFTRELERDIQVFLSKLEILNAKMCKARQQHDTEENECEMEHTELLMKLKENEMQVLNLESEINDLQDEIEQYKDLVLDKHRESLSWETKYKLVEETLRWRKDQINVTSETGNMKSEIHRMKIRYQQLSRAQDKLAQDLQHGVTHREHIFIAASAKKLAELKAQRMKSGISSQQKLIDLRNRLKKIQNEINVVTDEQLVKASRERERLHDECKRLETEIERMSNLDQQIRQQLDDSLLEKHLNLERIVRKQNRAKSYRRLGSSTSPKMPRSEITLAQLMQKQVEINDNLNDLVQTFIADFPDREKFFSKIAHIIRD